MTDKSVVTEDDMRLARKLARELDTLEGRARIALALAETRERAEAKLETAIARWVGQVETHQARIDELETNALTLRWAIEKKDKQISDLSEAFDESAARIAELEAENKRLLDRLAIFQRTVGLQSTATPVSEPAP